MKPINALIAWPVPVLRQLREEKREQLEIARREQRKQERLARKVARQEERRIARLEGKQEPAEDPADDVVEAEVEVSEKPELDALPVRVRKTVEHEENAPYFSQLERKSASIDGTQCKMQSVYVDDTDDIDALEQAGAVVLGVWSTVTGEQMREPHRRLNKFMPPRYETVKKGQARPAKSTVITDDGENETLEIDDETPQQILLIFGQAERKW